MNDFPTETIIKIFDYLDSYERKICRLVCKHWWNATKLPKYYQKISFTGRFYVSEVLFKAITESYHPFTKLCLKDVVFFGTNEFGLELLKGLAETVNELELINFCPQDQLGVWKALELLINILKPSVVTFLDGDLSQDINLQSKFLSVRTLKCRVPPKKFLKFVEHFPHLEELHVADYLTDMFAFYVASKICASVPKKFIGLVITCDTAPELINELAKIESLEVSSITFETFNQISDDVVENFLIHKGHSITKCTTEARSDVSRTHQLLSKYCTNLNTLRLLNPAVDLNLVMMDKFNKLKSLSINGDMIELRNTNFTLLHLKSLSYTVLGTRTKNLQKFTAISPNLKSILIKHVDAEILADISWQNLKLTEITLENVNSNSLKACQSFFKQKHLKSLRLFNSSCFNSGLLELFQWNQLRRLQIDGNHIFTRTQESIPKDTLKLLAKHCPIIYELELKFLNLNDESIEVIASDFKTLELLDITGNETTLKSYETLKKTRVRRVVHNNYERNSTGSWVLYKT